MFLFQISVFYPYLPICDRTKMYLIVRSLFTTFDIFLSVTLKFLSQAEYKHYHFPLHTLIHTLLFGNRDGVITIHTYIQLSLSFCLSKNEWNKVVCRIYFMYLFFFSMHHWQNFQFLVCSLINNCTIFSKVHWNELKSY